MTEMPKLECCDKCGYVLPSKDAAAAIMEAPVQAQALMIVMASSIEAVCFHFEAGKVHKALLIWVEITEKNIPPEESTLDPSHAPYHDFYMGVCMAQKPGATSHLAIVRECIVGLFEFGYGSVVREAISLALLRAAGAPLPSVPE